MTTAKDLYKMYTDGMAASNCEVDFYEALEENERIAWQHIANNLTENVELATKQQSLMDIHNIQINEPMSKTDPYMCGLANGLILAKSIMFDEHDPVMIVPPPAIEKQPKVGNTVPLTLEIDTTKITGLTELLMATDEFVSGMAGRSTGEATYWGQRFSAALRKIGAVDTDTELKAAVSVEKKLFHKTSIDGKVEQFYHLDGKPAQFDIDEELGELLLAVEKGLEFIHNGPAIDADEYVIAGMYNAYVVTLIPKLKALIENRITVAVPFHTLVDQYFDQFVGLPSNGKPQIQLDSAVADIGMNMYGISALLGAKRTGIELAQPIMGELASTIIDVQQIMNIFGWTWDDLKLKARQQIAALEEAKQ